MHWTLAAVPSSTGVSTVSLCGLNVVGTTNQQMIFGFNINQGIQDVNMIGHDAT
jgi:hypothetical protein